MYRNVSGLFHANMPRGLILWKTATAESKERLLEVLVRTKPQGFYQAFLVVLAAVFQKI